MLRGKLAIKVLSMTAILVSTLSLSGCGGLLPLPDEERYHYIHEIKDELSIESAGKILEESYDTGDGAFSASFLRLSLEGSSAFSKLVEEARQIENSECVPRAEVHLACYIEGIELTIDKNSEKDITVVQILDQQSGRRSK